jgi:MFS family permease
LAVGKYRGTAAILCNNLLLGFAAGMFLPLIPLRLHKAGIAASWIGVNAAASTLAILVIAPMMARILQRIGYSGAVGFGTILFALTLIGMMWWEEYGVWTALRFLAGLGLTLQWISCESWLNQVSPDHLRGRILSLYVASFIGGTAIGAAALDYIGTNGARPFQVMIALSLAAAVAILFGHGDAPAIGHMPKRALWIAAGQVPKLLAAALMMGVAQGSALGLVAFYGVRAGLGQGRAVWLQAVFLAGGVILQGPVGWATDRYDRHRLLALTAILSASASLVAHGLIETTVPLYTLWFLAGGMTFGTYTVALALLGSRFRGSSMAAANAAFILTWELGTLSGAPLSGAAIEWAGAIGFPLVMAGAMTVAMALAWWRARSAEAN